MYLIETLNSEPNINTPVSRFRTKTRPRFHRRHRSRRQPAADRTGRRAGPAGRHRDCGHLAAGPAGRRPAAVRPHRSHGRDPDAGGAGATGDPADAVRHGAAGARLRPAGDCRPGGALHGRRSAESADDGQHGGGHAAHQAVDGE